MVNEKSGIEAGEEKTLPIGLGFCGYYADANSSVVDVKNGKIVRIRPLHFDRQYDKKAFNPWRMEARGKVFEPPLKALYLLTA